jgi:hypothetical protein
MHPVGALFPDLDTREAGRTLCQVSGPLHTCWYLEDV